MKTLSIIALFVASLAIAFFSINFETAASLIFTFGFASVLVSDYTRRSRLRDSRARWVTAAVAVRGRAKASHLGLAA